MKAKNHFITILCAVLMPALMRSQVVGSLNSAINSQGTGVVGAGQNDLRWVSSLSSINGPFVPAVRSLGNAWWPTAPQPDVDWISYPHGCDVNDASVSGCVGSDHDEYFMATFSVACTGTYCINWKSYVDNCLYKMYLDQTASPFYTTPLTGNYFTASDHTSPRSGNLCTTLAAGNHQFYVHIKSGINPSSLSTSYTGFMFLATTAATCQSGAASFSVSTTQPCTNQQITLNDLSTNTPTAWAWQMTGGTPSISSITNPTVSYSTPGTYTISLITTNSAGSSGPAQHTVVVNSSPTVTASTSNTFICAGSNAVLVAGGATSYTWNTSQTTPSINVWPPLTTTYTVKGANANKCTNTATVIVRVETCTTAKQYSPGSSFDVYPNPVSENLSISNFGDAKEAILYNLLGEILVTTALGDHELNQVDMGTKPKGVYILKLIINDQEVIRKIIKE